MGDGAASEMDDGTYRDTRAIGGAAGIVQADIIEFGAEG